MRLVACLFAFLFALSANAAPLRFASWNIEHLGWSDDTRNYVALAEVVRHFDFMAIQEVMDAAALERLRVALIKRTGQRWESLVSHEIGRGGYKEAYAFLWRDAVISYAGDALVYLDQRDVFAREPYSARFVENATGASWIAATVHVLYGDGVAAASPRSRPWRAIGPGSACPFRKHPLYFLATSTWHPTIRRSIRLRTKPCP